MRPKTFTNHTQAVDALFWDGSEQSWAAIIDWAGNAIDFDGDMIVCTTPDGPLAAFPGDWIVNDGCAFFPMDQAIFSQKYGGAEIQDEAAE